MALTNHCLNILVIVICVAAASITEKNAELAAVQTRERREPATYRPLKGHYRNHPRPKAGYGRLAPLYAAPESIYVPPAYSTAPKPVYGAPPKPVYGAPPKPVYGALPKPIYGAPLKPVYGPPSKPVYGPPPKPFYGPPAKPAYGAPAKPVYGPPPKPVYGSPPFRFFSQADYGPPFKDLYTSGDYELAPGLQVDHDIVTSALDTHQYSSSPEPSINYDAPLFHSSYSSETNYPFDGAVEAYRPPPARRPLRGPPYSQQHLEFGQGGLELPGHSYGGYEVPSGYEAQPLSYDSASATYGTPGAVNSYGEPINNINFEPPRVHNHRYTNPYKRTNSLKSILNRDLLSQGSSFSEHRTPPTSTNPSLSQSASVTTETENKKTYAKAADKVQNHNYDGPGVAIK